MNNTILSTALLSILCVSAYADNVASPTPADSTGTAQPTATSPTTKPSAEPAVTPAAPVTPAATALQTPAVIDCNYRIPAETKTVDESVISTWAKKASVQSFEFNPTTIDQELVALKSCYTEQGWQGFNDALQKSGNINAIKSQHLSVNSQIDGDMKVNPVKDNQWKVTIPMQVVYQNDKDKLTQQLTVDLLIGRKVSGDLGIMQMIATPRQSPAAQATTKTVPTEKELTPLTPGAEQAVTH